MACPTRSPIFMGFHNEQHSTIERVRSHTGWKDSLLLARKRTAYVFLKYNIGRFPKEQRREQLWISMDTLLKVIYSLNVSFCRVIFFVVMKNQHVEFHSHNLPQTPWVGRRRFFREVSRFCGMRRCQSWPLTKSYDAAEGYAFAPDPNLPRFLYGVNEGTNIDTDSDMPPAQCAWCLDFFFAMVVTFLTDPLGVISVWS